MPRDTGFPRADAEADFLRARRQQVLSQAAARVRGREADDHRALSFQEVVDALGLVFEESIGLREIAVERVVGSVDKVRDFDPKFRPTSGRSRQRWERLALAVRRGESFPPIDVYQIGDMYFVRDGHHRVSVCRALDVPIIEADVTLVRTLIAPEGVRSRADLTRKELRRIMLQRVPMAKSYRQQVKLSDPHDYPRLAEMIEAWGARLMLAEQAFVPRDQLGRRWFEEEFQPAVQLIDNGGLRLKDETGADAYLRVAGERYSAFLEHIWNEEVISALRGKQNRHDLIQANVLDMLSPEVRDVLRGRPSPPGSD